MKKTVKENSKRYEYNQKIDYRYTISFMQSQTYTMQTRSSPWLPAGFFPGVGKFIGGVHFFPQFTTFFSRPQDRPKLQTTSLNESLPPSKKCQNDV